MLHSSRDIRVLVEESYRTDAMCRIDSKFLSFDNTNMRTNEQDIMIDSSRLVIIKISLAIWLSNWSQSNHLPRGLYRKWRFQSTSLSQFASLRNIICRNLSPEPKYCFYTIHISMAAKFITWGHCWLSECATHKFSKRLCVLKPSSGIIWISYFASQSEDFYGDGQAGCGLL